MPDTASAEVLYGINTIYFVRAGDALVQCRIKGKVLSGTWSTKTRRERLSSVPLPEEMEGTAPPERKRGTPRRETYNPIAPGDVVGIVRDPLNPKEGLITEIRERRTNLTRWNRKGRAPQVLAANADLAVCDDASLPPLPSAHCGVYLRELGDREALEQLADAVAAALRPAQESPPASAA